MLYYEAERQSITYERSDNLGNSFSDSLDGGEWGLGGCGTCQSDIDAAELGGC